MENGKQPPKDLKQAYRTSYLLAAYIKKTLTTDEARELEEWIAESDHNRQLFEQLTDKEYVEKSLATYNQADIEKNLGESKKQLAFNPPRKTNRLRLLLVAASIFVAVLLVYRFKPQPTAPATHPVVRIEEIYPEPGTVLLSIAGGSSIALPQHDTTLMQQVKVTGGAELAYSTGVEPAFHTLTTPAGTTYRLRLSDGTLVTLNCASSIRYPTTFTGSSREVELTGEAYFDVQHNASRPFLVHAAGMEVQDLGTAFNVHAYPGETSSVTLTQGSARVRANGKQVTLRPGEQATVTANSVTASASDTSLLLAWKYNEFRFANTPISDIMRQVGRWYDAQIIYTDSVKTDLNATIDRSVPVSKLLSLLAGTGEVNFRIEGRKIYVSK